MIIFEVLNNEHNVTGQTLTLSDDFVDRLLVDTSDRVGLTRPTEKEAANTLEGLKLRRQRRLTEEQLHNLYNCDKLPKSQLAILTLLKERKEISFENGKKVLNQIYDLDSYVLEEFKEWYDELPKDEIYKLLIYRKA